MVVLISGASHTGKTALAQKLLEKYKYPYLSIDHLKMGLIRSGNTALTPEDDEKLQEYLWPIVREIVKTAVENNQNLIVEGCYIPFDWRKDFESSYLGHIRFYVIVMTENYINGNFENKEFTVPDAYTEEEWAGIDRGNAGVLGKNFYNYITEHPELGIRFVPNRTIKRRAVYTYKKEG